MKVYAVLMHILNGYDGTYLDKVFGKEEDAKKYCDELNAKEQAKCDRGDLRDVWEYEEKEVE
jgi:hypothetical protein